MSQVLGYIIFYITWKKIIPNKKNAVHGCYHNSKRPDY